MKKLFIPRFCPDLAILLALLIAPLVPGLAQSPPASATPAAVRVSPEELATHLRRFVPPLLNEWQVPGVAVAVIQGDRVILAEGFGLRDVEQRLPVTPETVFAAGSATKAFTALAVGLLMEEGKLDWDRPVRSYLPDFRLRDPDASERVTPRDLLSHRTGLPGHDLMWYGSPASRGELLSHLGELEGSADLRSRFQYQNLMYMSAGALIEKAAGRRWEDVVRDRLLDPLGMRGSSLSLEALRSVENRASPYERRAGGTGVKKVPLRSMDAIAPAGSLNTNVVDLAKWVRLQLGDGRFEGKRVVSGATLRETQTPQIIVRDPSLTRLFLDEGQPDLHYGLGWYVQPYRGRHLIHHGGNIDGFTAFVSFLPQDGLGVVVLSNLGQTYLPYALSFHIYDRLLGLPARDWNGFFRARRQELDNATANQRKAEEEERKLGTRPSHPIEEYAGLYQHPAYGDLRIVRQGPGLGFTFNGLTGTLDHWHYDTWNLPAGQLRGLKLSFLINDRGEVDRVTVPLEASVGDIVFTRRRQDLAAAAENRRKTEEEERKLGTRPSHPIEEYAGLYQHPAHGDLRIVRQGLGLGFTFNGLTGTLDHWHYDTWKLPEGPLRGLKLSFLTNARGEIDRVTAPLEASAGDTVFTRRPPAELSDARQLRQYVGEYELSGQSATVTLQQDGLALSVPGQPTYELVPARGTLFNVKGLSGYSVRFIVEAGEVTAASFVQPNGVFKAVKRKVAG